MSARRAFVASACAVATILGVAQPAVASDGVTLALTSNVAKAKIGTMVEYTAVVENHSTESVAALTISIGLPDSLNARAMDCPTGGQDQVVSCPLGDFAPDSVAEVRFYVEAGDRNPVTNGPVSATASSGGVTILTAQLPPLKIVGKP